MRSEELQVGVAYAYVPSKSRPPEHVIVKEVGVPTRRRDEITGKMRDSQQANGALVAFVQRGGREQVVRMADISHTWEEELERHEADRILHELRETKRSEARQALEEMVATLNSHFETAIAVKRVGSAISTEYVAEMSANDVATIAERLGL